MDWGEATSAWFSSERSWRVRHPAYYSGRIWGGRGSVGRAFGYWCWHFKSFGCQGEGGVRPSLTTQYLSVLSLPLPLPLPLPPSLSPIFLFFFVCFFFTPLPPYPPKVYLHFLVLYAFIFSSFSPPCSAFTIAHIIIIIFFKTLKFKNIEASVLSAVVSGQRRCIQADSNGGKETGPSGAWSWSERFRKTKPGQCWCCCCVGSVERMEQGAGTMQVLLFCQYSCINRGYYTVTRRYGFYVRVARTMPHGWGCRAHEWGCRTHEWGCRTHEWGCRTRVGLPNEKYIVLVARRYLTIV